MASRYRRLPQWKRALVLRRDGYRCAMTRGCPNPATSVDHVIPQHHGGTDELDNLRAACTGCNSRGGAVISNRKGRRRLRNTLP